MLDVRSSFISLLDGLAVSHQSGTVTLNAAYYSDQFSETLPCVFVRDLTTTVEGAIGGGVEVHNGVYDLAIVAIDSPTVNAEVFLKDAANAINTAVRASWTNVGGAFGVRLIATRDLAFENADGTLIFTRVLTYRAHLVETY